MSIGEFDLRARLLGQSAPYSPALHCSRANCDRPADRRIEWRNPRIHSDERIKIWLACEEHFDFLLGFLVSRDFPVRVHAVDDEMDVEPIA